MARKVEDPVWEYVEDLLSEPELPKARYKEGRWDLGWTAERKPTVLERELRHLIDACQAGVMDLPQLKRRVCSRKRDSTSISTNNELPVNGRMLATNPL